MKSNAFRDQVAIVTGASAGIGKAMALRLASQGARLVIAARRADRLEMVADQCRLLGGETLTVPTDVSNEAQCKALVDKTVDAFGGLDLLVNNAGLAVTALFAELPNLDLFRHTLGVNFYGAVHTTYYALPHLERSQGRILVVSSMGGKAAIPYNTPYCASKYALHGFYDALRMELRQKGVSVTVICPWWVATEFHQALLDKNGVPRGEFGRAIYTAKTMTAERCAQTSLQAAWKRRREVLMGPGLWAVWLKVLAPGLMDRLAVKIVLEPILRRAKAAQVKMQP